MKEQFFAACSGGTEAVLEQELNNLSIESKRQSLGCEFTAEFPQVLEFLTKTRCSDRVYWKLFERKIVWFWYLYVFKWG